MSMSIYLTNLGKYNEGYLIGKWVKLPVAADKDAKRALEGVVKEAVGAQLGHAVDGKDLL